MFASGARGALSERTNANSPQVARHSTRASKFPHRLSFYDRPPVDEITLEEFEGWAIDRLRVLADIEAAQARNKGPEEIKAIVNARMKTYLPLSSDSTKGAPLDAERKKDLYSHFVLRLAFCRSEELRARFLKLETALFRIKWEADVLDDRRAFVRSLKFGWAEVSAAEKEELYSKLAASTYFARGESIELETYFKVHWTKVADLVEKRRVFVKGGQAYVPRKEELSLVVAEFTSRLSKALDNTARSIPRLDEDDRLLPVLEHLSQGFQAGITSDYVVAPNAHGEEITAPMVPALAVASFPLCMRQLQETLKSSKHLKHEGRQQYSLFLKGIGLSIEEALAFWRKSFANITDDKFKKDYQYNIRHNYGLEGSRKDYRPRNCQQIIVGKSPGPGESHGCPFRHYSEANLSSALQQSYRLSAGDQKEILGHVKATHYHLACTRLFEIQMGVDKGSGIGEGESVDHPNQYFDKSREILIERKKEDDSKVKSAKMDVDE